MAIHRLNSGRLSWNKLGEEIVALDLVGSNYLSMNPAGALLWEALSNGATYEQLVELLVSTYGIDEQSATQDLDHFLAQMNDQDLLSS